MTFEETIELIEKYPELFTENIREIITSLVTEIKHLKTQVSTLQLLIEHEEKIRTTKAKPIAGGTNIRKFKPGDIVDYNPIGSSIIAKAKVEGFVNGRFQIVLLEHSGAGKEGTKRWVGSKQLQHHSTK